MRRIPILALLSTLTLLAFSATSALAGTRTSGYYDHQVIEYESTVVTASSIQEAQLAAHGNIVYHVVDSTGNVPAVQCMANTLAFPNDATDCNVLNFIPTEVGYAGGAWNLRIFHWNAGKTVMALTKDDDITGAAANGDGWIEVTMTLVRCPLVNFSNLR
jgi:hypothetical protein